MKSLRFLLGAVTIAGGLTWAAGSAVAGASTPVTPVCLSSHLRLSFGAAEGAAGTIFIPLVVTNLGPACAMWGVPAIQPVVLDRARHVVAVGPRARNNSIGQMPVRHVVAHGRSLSDAVGVTETGNYTPSTCRPRNTSGIVVSLGGFIRHAYLPLKVSVCTRLASTTTRLLVPGKTGN